MSRRMELQGKIAVVTGAGGMLGTAVVDRLAREGMKVRAIVRNTPLTAESAVELAHAELGDAAAEPVIARAVEGAHLVVHCAAVAGTDAECRRSNIEGTRRIVEAALAARVELFIHVSTVSVYDESGAPNFDEESPLRTNPAHAYGWTKAEAERVVRAAETRGLRAVILRPVVVLSMHAKSYWGPRAVERARADAKSVIGMKDVPYVHVDNLVDSIVLAARGPQAIGKVYNVVDDHADAREYLAAVFAAVGTPPPELPATAPALRFSGEKIRRELAYAPKDRWREFLAELALYR
jgi:nucleoside-diphosphate-sugar epimerase